MFDPAEIREVLDEVTPKDWRRSYARGMVYVPNEYQEANAMRSALIRWAKDEGFPLRIPHHSVQDWALSGPSKPGRQSSELELAAGGLLLLEPYSSFDSHALYNIDKRVTREQIPVVVVGIDTFEPAAEPFDAFIDRVHDRADTGGLNVVRGIDEYEDYLDEAREGSGRASSVAGQQSSVALALAAINDHRRQIGMPALDPVASDWTAQDVELEAQRIARLPNPILDLKRSLLW